MPSRVFLTSGGGDSIDVAAKLARRYWFELGQPDRTMFVSRTQGYHGTHGYGTAIGGIAANRVGFGPQLESEQVPHDSVEALEEAFNRIGAERIAAFFLEPVIGAGGVHPPGHRYIEGVAALCERNGVLLVADAVICGFGRLGNWFGIERWDAKPDMITFAKGVTSGYLPLGGVIISDAVAEPFWQAPSAPVFRHGATYAGHSDLHGRGAREPRDPRARGPDRARRRDGAAAPRRAQRASPTTRPRARCAAASARSRQSTSTPSCSQRDPAALGRLTMGAREAGVLLRQLGRGIAVSPPLTAGPEHFELITQAIAAGLDAAAAR